MSVLPIEICSHCRLKGENILEITVSDLRGFYPAALGFMLGGILG